MEVFDRFVAACTERTAAPGAAAGAVST
jgi:hypothetical protein